MGRASGIFLVAVMVCGCASPPAATQTTSSPPPQPASTPSPSAAHATTSPAPTVAPSRSAAPVTATTLSIRWNADDPTGIPALSTFVGVARSGDTYVLVGEKPVGDEDFTFAAWWSDDGREWELAQEFPMGQRILTLIAGGPGFVVAGLGGDGAAVWTSADGRAWQPVSDASLRSGVIRQLVPTASGVVGFGSRSDTDTPAIWTSADGIAGPQPRTRPG